MMMKVSAFVMMFSMVLASGMQCFAADAGSSGAAKDLVPEYLGKLYTIVEQSVIQGDKAIVKAKLFDLNCILTLVHHATANKYGWVVEKQDCKK
jgi:hypothetical protein